MPKPFYILGNGGHARVIASMVNGQGTFNLLDCVSAEDEEQFLSTAASNTSLAIGIGENITRKHIAEKLNDRAFSYPVIKHDTAIVASDVKIGRGSVIMPGVIINSGTTIGEFCVINTGAIIEHDSSINNHASVAPAAVICGGCTIGEGAYIGANATISHGVTIGQWSVVGAGSIALEDIAENKIYVGAPAKFLKNKTTQTTIL